MLREFHLIGDIFENVLSQSFSFLGIHFVCA